MEHNIYWQIKEGGANFWFDNWTKLSALYFLEETNNDEEEMELKDFVTEDGGWNVSKLRNYISKI